jgi:hypothetical protein
MLKGDSFAQVFTTTHGPLLVYTEFRYQYGAVLHQTMQFGGKIEVNPREGTADQVRIWFAHYDILHAEATAMLMSLEFEREHSDDADSGVLGLTPVEPPVVVIDIDQPPLAAVAELPPELNARPEGPHSRFIDHCRRVHSSVTTITRVGAVEHSETDTFFEEPPTAKWPAELGSPTPREIAEAPADQAPPPERDPTDGLEPVVEPELVSQDDDEIPF